MLKLSHSMRDRADKIGLLDTWCKMAEEDPQAALVDRFERSALSAVAMDDPANQNAVLSLMSKRALTRSQFLAAQRILCNAALDENMRRIELEKLLAPEPPQDSQTGDTHAG